MRTFVMIAFAFFVAVAFGPQSAAMSKAKKTLKAAVDKAIGQGAGFRAISATPELKDGHAVASVELLKGQEFKTVQQSLE